MSVVGELHGRYVHSRRVNVLTERISQLIPPNANVLDVGCGDGLLSTLIMQNRPDIEISGIDVLVRKDAKIPVTGFDGTAIPFADDTFDTAIFVDVLHHTDNQLKLLDEARRVTRHSLVIKDHLLNGVLAGLTLRLMDWVGNASHGVALPYNYWPEEKWKAAFESLNLRIDSWQTQLKLYPSPANLIFDRSLHFIARLTARSS